jgi:hypothetical protein
MKAIDPSDRSADSPSGRTTMVGRTTIELYETDDGRWLATQADVDATGVGSTAAEAATEFCWRVADTGPD